MSIVLEIRMACLRGYRNHKNVRRYATIYNGKLLCYVVKSIDLNFLASTRNPVPVCNHATYNDNDEMFQIRVGCRKERLLDKIDQTLGK